MSKQEKGFFEGKKMSDDEIKEYFLKKAGSRIGDFDKETQRIIKELEDFKAAWLKKTISKFLDSPPGKKFIEEHKNQDPDKAFEILLRYTNIAELYNLALEKKIAAMRGKVT